MDFHDTPVPQNEFLTSLYHRYGQDLCRVQRTQREVYSRLRGYPMFGDVEGEWLYLFTRHLGEDRPVLALEVGVGCGWSTSWILQGLVDNRAGHLTSVDIQSIPQLPARLTKTRWTFVEHDVLTCLNDLPSVVDLLLIDANHDSPMVEQIHAALLPRCRAGGITAVHDVYMLPQPRHAEAASIFAYLNQHAISPFSPSPCFQESWEAIQAVRHEIGLGPNIHINEINSSLWFQVPDEKDPICQ